MLLTRSATAALTLLAACGPRVAPPLDDGGETGATTAPATSSSGGVGEADGGSQLGEEGDADGGPGSATGSVDDAVVPYDLPPADPPPGWCEDPAAVDPLHAPLYRFCLRGMMEFNAHAYADGSLGYSAYAQFFTVHAEAEIEWEEEILDPYEGPGDCALRRYGNSGWGELEQVLWEDAGDVTFVTPTWSIPGMEYGDPVSVIGYEASSLAKVGLEPSYGAFHGLIATGDTTPAFDLPESVVLPDPITGVDPPIFDSPAVDHATFVVSWEPSELAFPTWLFLNVPIADNWDYTLYCNMDDSGLFAVPAALLAQLPLPVEANVYMSRTDAKIVGHDGDRGILARAWTSTEGHLTIE